jgi:hypothetical protein
MSSLFYSWVTTGNPLATGDWRLEFWPTPRVFPGWFATNSPSAPSSPIRVECVRRMTRKFATVQSRGLMFTAPLIVLRPRVIRSDGNTQTSSSLLIDSESQAPISRRTPSGKAACRAGSVADAPRQTSLPSVILLWSRRRSHESITSHALMSQRQLNTSRLKLRHHHRPLGND